MSAQPNDAANARNQPAWRAGVRPLSSNELTLPGPFYCLTLGAPCILYTALGIRAFEGMEDGGSKLAETFWPGVLYCVRKDDILMDIEVANEKGQGAFERLTEGGRETLTAVPTVPGDNRRYLIQTHGRDGLVFYDAFEGLSEAQVQPYLFSKMIRPVILKPEYVEDKPDLQEAIKKQGALAVYHAMFADGVNRVKSSEFRARYGGELQALYVRAFPAVEATFRAAKQVADKWLTAEDARVNRGLAKGAHYDSLGEYYQYLTARPGVNTLGSREVNVNFEGLKEHLSGAAATVATETIWCEECGGTTNLGPRGQVPKRCPQCKTLFEQPDAEASIEESAGANLRARETRQERTARLQAEALERKGK